MEQSSYHALLVGDANPATNGTIAKTTEAEDDSPETPDAPPSSKPAVVGAGTAVLAGTQAAAAQSDAVAPEETTTGTPANTSIRTTRVENVALVNAVADVAPGVADIMQRAQEKEYKGSPAERRKAVYADMERLRTHALYLRDAAEEKRSAEVPDEAEAKRLIGQAKQCEQALAALSAVYDALLSRAERRAGRDASLKALDRDPSTGKKWKGAHVYDPRRPEMQELYKEKTHPAHVFADGPKLVRADGGQYGLLGSLILVVHDAAERAGETVSDAFMMELVKGVAYDVMERVHGIGAGYCRDAAWLLELWARETKTPLRIDDLPVRHPIKSFEDWAETEFPTQYEKARKRVGLDGANDEAAIESGGA